MKKRQFGAILAAAALAAVLATGCGSKKEETKAASDVASEAVDAASSMMESANAAASSGMEEANKAASGAME